MALGGRAIGRWFLTVTVVAVVTVVPRAAIGQPLVSHFCTDASQREFVVQQACRAIPGLRKPDVSVYAATKLLRIWADTWIDIAATGYTLGSNEFLSSNIDERYRGFLEDVGGVFCFHSATTLMALYRAFGFQSWVLSVGDINTYTHAVTLVRVGQKLVVEDAFLNYSLVDQSGRPLDVREAMRRLHRGRFDLVRHEEPRVAAPRDVLYTQEIYDEWRPGGPQDAPHFPAGSATNLRSCKTTNRGWVVCSVPDIRFARLGFFMVDLAAENPVGYAAMPGRSWREKAALWFLRPYALTSPTSTVFLGKPTGTPLDALFWQLVRAAGESTTG